MRTKQTQEKITKYRKVCKKKTRKLPGAVPSLRDRIDPAAYYDLPPRPWGTPSIAVHDGHRAFVHDCARMGIVPEAIAHELNLTVDKLFEHFGEIIEKADEILMLQNKVYIHRLAFDPTRNPQLEVQLCKQFEVEPTLEKSKEFPELELHWVVILRDGLGPEWLNRKRPDLPDWYFDRPSLPVVQKKAA
jgi:hypothetical protein